MEKKKGIPLTLKLARWIIAWQKKNIGNHTILIIASSIVGIFSARAAVLLKLFVHQLHRIPDLFYKWSNIRFISRSNILSYYRRILQKSSLMF